jgi:hypothetical protein
MTPARFLLAAYAFDFRHADARRHSCMERIHRGTLRLISLYRMPWNFRPHLLRTESIPIFSYLPHFSTTSPRWLLKFRYVPPVRHLFIALFILARDYARHFPFLTIDDIMTISQFTGRNSGNSIHFSISRILSYIDLFTFSFHGDDAMSRHFRDVRDIIVSTGLYSISIVRFSQMPVQILPDTSENGLMVKFYFALNSYSHVIVLLCISDISFIWRSLFEVASSPETLLHFTAILIIPHSLAWLILISDIF